MSLNVTVLGATNLKDVDKIGLSDPFCIVEFLGEKKETKVIDGELNPKWNEKLEFNLKGQPLSPRDTMTVKVMDKETIGPNKLLGIAKVSLKDVTKGDHKMSTNVNLMDANDVPNTGTVNLVVEYKPPPNTSSKGGGTTITTSQSVDHEDAAGGDEGGTEEVEEPGEPGPDGQPGIPKKVRKKVRRKMDKQLSTKPQDFQIRVKIVEARQLQGANICPVARVTCFNQTKQTRVKKSTNTPFWNEVFFFNFFTSPSELFDQLLSFQVFNSRKLRSDSLIGSFKCDIGMVYDSESNHTLMNKWLLLSDPEDTMAGAKGYLKISAAVLGPGDEAPSFQSIGDEDGDDIEANLLRPAGVQLRPATFILRVYKAEDLPRMDSDAMEGMKRMVGLGDAKKELVDPYLIFSFAGKEVRTKIMYTCDHPEFNQELRLGLRFPSMCERIKICMKDWDRLTEDDPIGTSLISLSQISAQGNDGDEGFLPTFGPCYVNFYGSPREYSDLPDEFEDMNLGKGEGCCYRGRCMVELKTNLGEMPDNDVEDLNNDFVLRAGKFMRRRKYRLHCAFLSASMIKAIDAPVEFEVSIGNYGNKLDAGVPASSSTTQPTNAVFDGLFYHFLPWGNSKPCTVVESHWEDISFRLEALNLINKMIVRLEENLQKVALGIKANLPTPEQAQLLISTLDQLIEDCSTPMPDITTGQNCKNDLDEMLTCLRANEMAFIVKEASKLRESATDVEEAMHEIEGYKEQLLNIALEPQNSMPDVIIWMLSGEKRIAYYRIPAYEVLYSPKTDLCGKNCGREQTIFLRLPGQKPEKEGKNDIPAMVRCKIWLGQEREEHAWNAMQTVGELAVFAETYENQVNVLGMWTDKGPTMTRPKWSDASGKMKLPKTDFNPPTGWQWDADWFISPELSMLFDKDAGHKQYLEDVFENQGRIPGGEWGLTAVPWTDVKGDLSPSRDEMKCPQGWLWEDDWQVDFNRPCDEEGFEYTVEATLGGYLPTEKTYHMCRRRRWVRSRTLVQDVEDDETTKGKSKKKKELLAKDAAEGWEYAPLFNMKFHAKERKMDLVRRRRWHRKMRADQPSASCFFQIGDPKKKDHDAKDKLMAAPRMFLKFEKAFKYQLRAYVYQARDLLAGDQDGLSDPFARVIFMNQSLVSERIDKTLCPTWDQTLIFETVEIHGDPRMIAENPPLVVAEVFDHDTFGEDELLGRMCTVPMVKLDPSDGRTPVLQWTEMRFGSKYAGEMLAAFELFLISPDKLDEVKSVSRMMNGKDLPFQPPKRGTLYLVPNGIRPIMQRTGIEVLCWGVRNMKKFQLANVTSPSIQFEIGGHIITSNVIKNTKKNPNFSDPLLFFDVMLPREELYMPPMNIRVRDHRQFGRKPMVGLHVIKTLDEFMVDPLPAAIVDEEEGALVPVSSPGAEHVVDMPEDAGKKKGGLFNKKIGFPQLDTSGLTNLVKKKPKDPTEEEYSLLDEDIDWWSKFYASIGELAKCKKYLDFGYDTLQVYKSDLENVLDHTMFTDFCTTFELKRGKCVDEEESDSVGEFKGTFRVYPLPGDPNAAMPTKHLGNVPPSDPMECLVRVYLIRAYDLQPNDPSGLADPYVCVTLGKNKVNNKDNYKPNTLNPMFGKLFELKTTIPLNKDLHISVKDYDFIGTDDIIGETTIDLENRLLSKYRATCGLPKTYCTDGPTKWRDVSTPKEILDNFCDLNHLPKPTWFGNNCVKVGPKVYNLSDFERNLPPHGKLGACDERLALHILNTLPLVKEHVETRPLYSPIQPGIEQGKLQLFVDVFPMSLGVPPAPIDISVRVPKKYVLRIVVWCTEDVILEEESITGEMMSDIYVKGWLAGIEEMQETDVHYRSMDGEGLFNWRFVFPFDYLPAEQSMVVKKKEHFWSLDETEQKSPPILMIQIWDNDKFSADDFLGTLELNLNSMPVGTKKASQCDLSKIPDGNEKSHTKDIKMISLFDQRRIRGFWPCYNDETGVKELTGKVEMELELVTEEEALLKPAGRAQEEPNDNPHLEKPKRPETSFLWFTSPFKTLKYIIWKNYKWYFITSFVIVLFVLLLVLFFYSFPGAIANRIVG